jgi:hypothetical protein
VSWQREREKTMDKTCSRCRLRVVRQEDPNGNGFLVLIVNEETKRVHYRYLVPNPTSERDLRQVDCCLRMRPCGFFDGGEHGCPLGVYVDHGEVGFKNATGFETFDFEPVEA